MVKSLFNEKANLDVKEVRIMWKRYGITLVFCLFVTVSLVIFYSTSGKVAQENEHLQLKTLSGEVDETKDLKLIGNSWVNRMPKKVEVSLDGSDYSKLPVKNLVTYETVTMSYYVKLDELQHEYKSFMRGKWAIDSLYEDETQLIYVHTLYNESEERENTEELLVDFYNKKSKDTTQFTVSLPSELKDHNDYIGILDVQMMKDQLIIILDSQDEGKQSVYYLAIKGGKISDSHILLEASPKENVNIRSAGNLINDSWIKTSKYMLLEKDTWDAEKQSSTYEMYAVELASAQVKKVNVPGNSDYGEQRFYNGQTVYYLEKNYFKKLDLDTLNSSILSDDLNISDIEGMKEKDQRLYVLALSKNGSHLLIIYDLNDNKEIYRGEVNPKEYKKISSIELYDVQF